MTKTQMLDLISSVAAAYFKGGTEVRDGLTKLFKPNENPNDNVDEVIAAIALLAVGLVTAAEDVTNKDLVDDADFKTLVDNVQRDIKLFQKIFFKPSSSVAGSTVAILD